GRPFSSASAKTAGSSMGGSERTWSTGSIASLIVPSSTSPGVALVSAGELSQAPSHTTEARASNRRLSITCSLRWRKFGQEGAGTGAQRLIPLRRADCKAEPGKAGHAEIGDPAGHDAGKVAEVGVQVDCEAVHRDPLAHPHADRADLRLRSIDVARPDPDPVGN